MNSNDCWHYSCLSHFNHIQYGNVLKDADLTGEVSLRNEHYWLAYKDRQNILITPGIVSELPIIINKTEKEHYNKNIYHIVTDYTSIKFKSEKDLEFRDFINNYLCPFEHTVPEDYTLAKLIYFSGISGKGFYRISAPAAFGKGSIPNTFSLLMNNCTVISPKSLASIEYRLGVKLLCLDELGNAKNEDIHDIEHFLLDAGDGSPKYEKPKRGSRKYKTKDTYDISKLSVVLLSNLLSEYNNEDKFLDNRILNKAVLTRYLPCSLFGCLGTIPLPKDIHKTVEQNKQKYLEAIHTITYFSNDDNIIKEQKDFNSVIETPANRDYNNYENLKRIFNIYSKDEKEFNDWEWKFFNAYEEYPIDNLNSKRLICTDKREKEYKIGTGF